MMLGFHDNKCNIILISQKKFYLLNRTVIEASPSRNEDKKAEYYKSRIMNINGKIGVNVII